MSEKLLPCPHCGSNNVDMGRELGNPNWYYIFCRECWVEGKYDLGESGAAENWNTRHYPPEVRAIIEIVGRITNQKSMGDEMIMDFLNELCNAMYAYEEMEKSHE